MAKAHQCGEVNFSVADLPFVGDVLFTLSFDAFHAGRL